ncbi:MAG: phage tail family protein [Bacillaceae bacterium]|nr:phage tail family protein [Bacillaceae bacterium]
MIKGSLHFTYDGIHSSEMKCQLGSLKGGLYEETFLASKAIIEEKIRGNDTPYHYGVERNVLEIPMSVYFPEEMTDEDVRRFCRWIDQDYYKELYFDSNPKRRFYAMFEGVSKHLSNGIKANSIVMFNMRTNNPYSYSPVYTSDIYDLSENEEGTDITFINEGDVICKPILEFEKVGNGDISIVNMSDGGREFKMENLLHGERIKVDSHYETIETDAPGMYRYDNHNDVYLDFPRGHNYLKVYGKVKDMRFVYQFQTKA